jgi:hypothetical protein
MRNKTAPPTQKHQSKPLNPRDGLIAKKKKQKQSVKESCVLDNHSHRTAPAVSGFANAGSS